jgi:hypothetical protein
MSNLHRRRGLNASPCVALLVLTFAHRAGATIVETVTSCQEGNNKEPIFLDRFAAEIACGANADAKLMNGFSYVPCASPNFKFNVQCLDPVYNYPTSSPNCVTTETSNSAMSDTTVYLDRHPVDCTAGKALKSWKVSSAAWGCTS